MENNNVFFFLKFKNDVRFFYDNLPVSEALELMKKHGFTAVPVIDQEGIYKGSVSEGDFLWFVLDEKHSKKDLDEYTVGDLLRDSFMPAAPNSISFDDLLAISLHQNYVPIIDDRGIFIGIVTRQAILNYFLEEKQSLSLSPQVIQIEKLDRMKQELKTQTSTAG